MKIWIDVMKLSKKEYCRFLPYLFVFRLHSKTKSDINSSSGNYSGYGVTGPTSNTLYFHESGDRKLAQSAQMYHYQHQKQQMIDMEK